MVCGGCQNIIGNGLPDELGVSYLFKSLVCTGAILL